MKKIHAVLISIVVIVISIACGSKVQVNLDKTRYAKLDAVINTIIANDAVKFHELLDEKRNMLSLSEAKSMLQKIRNFYGDISLAKESKAEESSLDKGNMEIIAEYRFSPTNFGKFRYITGSIRSEGICRIGLLFPKGSSTIGSFHSDFFSKKKK
ncbi:MAG: hypothetical protein GY754_35855 [bacterium]|nr:hypothetical protein [bacterium]